MTEEQNQHDQDVQQTEIQEEHDQGMTLEQAQTLLKDRGLTVTESKTTPKKANKKPRPVWLVRGRLDPFRELLYELGGKTRGKGRNTFSFWSDPTIGIAEGIEARGEATIDEQVALRDERSEYRADRYNQRAQSQLTQRDQAYRRSSTAVEGIEPGQPILVGHHSERHHRRAIERSNNAMSNAVAADRTAADLSYKAAGSEAQVQKRQSKSYMGNRLEEAQAKKRQAERYLTRFPSNRTYQLDLQDAESAIAHWSEQLKGAGVLTQDDIGKGDYVSFMRRWYEVVRVNKKSVTITGWLGIDGNTWRPKYSEIAAHKTKAEVEGLEAQAEAAEQKPKG